MRRIYRYAITIILLICFSLYSSCQITVKKVTGFKKIIQKIDTLAIIPSFVDIRAVGVDNILYSDIVFSPKLSDTITFMISKLLKKKYHLKQETGNSKIDINVAHYFNSIIKDLKQSGNLSPDIQFQDSIMHADNSNCRYCLMTVFTGLYWTNEKIRKEAKDALPGSLAVGILSLGTVMSIQVIPSYLDMKFLLYDRIDKRILYYKADVMPTLNKVDFWRINQFVMNNLKTIYYK
jgi:hypothetical protein